jgi:hypothetical protein
MIVVTVHPVFATSLGLDDPTAAFVQKITDKMLSK